MHFYLIEYVSLFIANKCLNHVNNAFPSELISKNSPSFNKNLNKFLRLQLVREPNYFHILLYSNQFQKMEYNTPSAHYEH